MNTKMLLGILGLALMLVGSASAVMDPNNYQMEHGDIDVRVDPYEGYEFNPDWHPSNSVVNFTFVLSTLEKEYVTEGIVHWSLELYDGSVLSSGQVDLDGYAKHTAQATLPDFQNETAVYLNVSFEFERGTSYYRRMMEVAENETLVKYYMAGGSDDVILDDSPSLDGYCDNNLTGDPDCLEGASTSTEVPPADDTVQDPLDDGFCDVGEPTDPDCLDGSGNNYDSPTSNDGANDNTTNPQDTVLGDGDDTTREGADLLGSDDGDDTTPFGVLPIFISMFVVVFMLNRRDR